MRRVNVFFIIFEFHESNFDNIIEVFQNFRHFDQNTILNLSQFIRVCAFLLCFLNDMSQQSSNFKFKFQKTNKNCRFCFILIENCNNFEFDIVKQKRFYTFAINQQREMKTLRIKQQKKQYVNK